MRRAESPQARKSSPAAPRFEIDRVWLWRCCLALVIVGFILVLAKASLMLVGSGNTRLERHERSSEPPAASQPASPAKPSTPG